MINKEEILLKTDQGLDIFRHFLGSRYQKLGKAFNSPFYKDTKAACYIYKDKRSGVYKFKDFGDSEFSGDCFFFVSKIFALDSSNSEDFVRILEIINQELSLGLESTADKMQRLEYEAKGMIKRASQLKSIHDGFETATFINPLKIKEFSQKELDFWKQYGITRDILDKFRVVSIESFEGQGKQGKEYILRSTEAEPIFGYQGRKHTKIYRPFSNTRFLYVGELTENYCFGFEQLPSKGDIVFITGGEKDVLSLTAHGFYAISMNSETANIPKNLIRGLTFRFKHITLLYDTDETGIKSMMKLMKDHKDYKVDSLLLPLSGIKDTKDVSDFFAKGHTAQELRMLFLEMIEGLYDESLSILKSCEVDFDFQPETPEPLIAINEVTVGSPGNILCIAGSEGSGKSNYLGSIISGSIKLRNTEIDTLGTYVKENQSEKAVLFYDTEQSEYQLFKNLQQILKRSKRQTPPAWFKAYGLVGVSRGERMKMILESMDKFYYEFGGIQLVVIDGIADLINSVNDEESSVQLIEELFRLAAIYNTVIVCVLHISPSAMKLRGHLGSEVQRKAAGILLIEKDDENQTSTLKALKVRDGSPLDVPIIEFGWSKEDGRHIFIGYKSKEAAEERKLRELTAIARSIFDNDRQIKVADLTEKIMEALSVRDRMARNHIKFLKDHGIIESSTQFPNIYRLKN